MNPKKSQSLLKARDPKTARPSKAKILIFGAPGVGKTWVSLDFPSVYYIDTEGGANRPHYTDKLKAAGGLYLGPEDGSLDYSLVVSQVQALATEEHKMKTFVLDSFTKIYSSAATQAAERFIEKEKGSTGDEFGRDKKEANRPTRRLLQWVSKLDMNVIFICHERPVWENGEQVGFTYEGYDKLGYELDLVLHIQRRGDERVAVVKKSRLLEFPQLSFFPWKYSEFAKRYGQQIIEEAAVPLTMATPEQVAELEKLVAVLRVTDEETSKWLVKAGAESFAEMDQPTIGKCIDFLKKKIDLKEENAV